MVGSDSGRIVILEYHASKNMFEKVHQETFGKSGCRRIVPGQFLAVDPKGRAVMIGEGFSPFLCHMFKETIRMPFGVQSIAVYVGVFFFFLLYVCLLLLCRICTGMQLLPGVFLLFSKCKATILLKNALYGKYIYFFYLTSETNYLRLSLSFQNCFFF